eukprot:TRINITY_DN1624_c0_g2_i13.p1 TRINITY_DN1624_c0_g2~~TRINITY_DN1624_c0_g2_i13.p1  ORF type:complete len:284 (+),score=69.36 TRINITY_DN1624_c0_g2_i13:73-852(+)
MSSDESYEEHNNGKKENWEQDEEAVPEESSTEMDHQIYKNEKDREWLQSLPEIEREKIIYERDEERREKKEQQKIRRERTSGQQQKPANTPNHSGFRRGSNTEKSGDRRTSALHDIKAKRADAKNTKAQKRSNDRSSSEDEYDKYARVEEEEFRKDEPPTQDIIKKSDLMSVVVTRNKLEKWYGEPYFVKDAIGLFVRVACGNQAQSKHYKLVEILSVFSLVIFPLIPNHLIFLDSCLFRSFYRHQRIEQHVQVREERL